MRNRHHHHRHHTVLFIKLFVVPALWHRHFGHVNRFTYLLTYVHSASEVTTVWRYRNSIIIITSSTTYVAFTKATSHLPWKGPTAGQPFVGRGSTPAALDELAAPPYLLAGGRGLVAPPQQEPTVSPSGVAISAPFFFWHPSFVFLKIHRCFRVGRLSVAARSRRRFQFLRVRVAAGGDGEHRSAVCRSERHRRQLVPLSVPRRLPTHRQSDTRLQQYGTVDRHCAVVCRHVPFSFFDWLIEFWCAVYVTVFYVYGQTAVSVYWPYCPAHVQLPLSQCWLLFLWANKK